jgi:hypothetical protein
VTRRWPSAAVEGVLEELEARDAILVQGDKLSVDGIVLDLLQSLGN